MKLVDKITKFHILKTKNYKINNYFCCPKQHIITYIHIFNKWEQTHSKFGSDLDAVTLNVIEKGKRNVEILKQGLNSPFTVEDQVAIIYAGSKNLLRNVPVEKVKEFEKDFLEYLNAKHRDTLNALKAGKFDDNITDVLEKVAKEISAKYN